MDLSDGSDVEGEVDLDQLEENALLGSDDEELVHEHYEEYDEDQILQTEDGDVLELELNEEDGLEFGDDDPDYRGNRRLAPVQVRASAIPHLHDQSSSNFRHADGGMQSSQNQDYNSIHKEMEEVLDGEDEDDDDDSKNTRSRFRSERNPGSTLQSATQSSSIGNPIQTLGGRKVPTGGGDLRQKQWGNNRNHSHPQEQRQFPRPQRFPSSNRQTLLGEGPRPGFNHMNRPRPQRMNGPPVVQFQGRIFTDFNTPMRVPNLPQQQQPQPPFRGQGPPQGPSHLSGPPNQGGQNEMSCQQPGNMNGQMRFNNPRFSSRPGPDGNNRIMRPRNGGGPRHQNVPQRPPNHHWRNQRPQRQPFSGAMPNQQPPPIQNVMPNVHPNQNMFMQDQRQPHPNQFYDQGPCQDINAPPMRFNHPLPAQNIPLITPQQAPFPPGGGLIRQPLRMQMIPQGMQHPQQQMNPFYPSQQQQQQPFMQEPNHPPGQNTWQQQHSNPSNQGWIPPHNPQHFGGPPQPPPNTGYAPHIEAMQHHHQHQSQFVENPVQMHQYEQHPYERSNPPNCDPHHQQYSDHETVRHDSHGVNYPPSEPRTQTHLINPHRREAERTNYDHSRHERDRVPSKRKYDIEDTRFRGSPEKRLNGRLGPPVKPPVRDEEAEQLLKIREESKKTVGADDEYIKKLEEQKKLREQILRRKAESRRKVNSTDNPEEESSSHETPQSSSRPSIYLNPKAFKGDLTALNLNLKKVNMSSHEANKATLQLGTRTSVAGGDGKVKTTKPRTILKIIKDKHGNVISRSKVIYVPKQPKQDGRASTKAS